MNVIVVGAGIIGVCTAHFLREAGHAVTVIDRRAEVAQETSFGNAGIIAPGYVTPWAAPGMPGKILSYLFKAESPVLFRPSLDPALWRWLVRWLGECKLERYRVNKERMQRIALYSRGQLHALRESLGLQYEQAQGYLQLYRSDQDYAMGEPARAMLAQAGVPFREFSAEQCREHEPALSAESPLAAGLYLPQDESGNCPLFARLLKQQAEAAGVTFRFNSPVTALARQGGRITGVVLESGAVAADAVIVAAAVDSVPLLAPHGVRVPIYPVKGYSATVSLKQEVVGPRQAIMDEAYKTAITPFGRRLRIAGTAEIGSHELVLRKPALRTLLKVASDWFPGIARYQEAQYWVGARPMVPDGPPLLGATPLPGLFLNLGHGSTGWAMACGSGKVLADVVSGREPEISLDGLTLARYA